MPDTATRTIDAELRAVLARQHETAALLADLEAEMMRLMTCAVTLSERFDVLLERRFAARAPA